MLYPDLRPCHEESGAVQLVSPHYSGETVNLAAQWVPVRETTCVNLAGYIVNHLAGQQYSGYWQQSEVQYADQQVAKP
jgi:hypothetical protein